MTSSVTPPATGSRSIPQARSPRVLDAVSAMCVIAAAALFVWPVSTPTPATTAPAGNKGGVANSDASVTRPTGTPGSAPDTLVVRVVNGNVFSATRKAPTTRFRLPSDGAEANVVSSMISPAEGAVTPGMTNSEDFPRLSGIVTLHGERRALLQLLAADGVPQLYRVGDAHGGYRVLRIEADRVVLAGRNGSRTVKLASPAKADTLALPQNPQRQIQ